MALTELLKDEHWKDYDNRKVTGNPDRKYFACTEAWEFNYLRDLIKRRHPVLTIETISAAILTCCKEIGAPHPRKTFVECVVKRLGLSTL